MRKLFTREYWTGPQAPGLFWVFFWALLAGIYFGEMRLLEYLTRP